MSPTRLRITVTGVVLITIMSAWGMVEALFSVDSFSLGLGFGLGLLSFPILQWIYDFGFNSNYRNAYIAMGISFAFKGFLLFGSYVVLNRLLNLSFREYMFPLFFTVFSLGFVAIYLARQQSDFSFASD